MVSTLALAGRGHLPWKSAIIWAWKHNVSGQNLRSDAQLQQSLGLFSLVTLMAHPLQADLPVPQTAWYVKTLPTFGDALALVRCVLWKHRLFRTSTSATEIVKVPLALLECWTDLLCYAA